MKLTFFSRKFQSTQDHIDITLRLEKRFFFLPPRKKLKEIKVPIPFPTKRYSNTVLRESYSFPGKKKGYFSAFCFLFELLLLKKNKEKISKHENFFSKKASLAW